MEGCISLRLDIVLAIQIGRYVSLYLHVPYRDLFSRSMSPEHDVDMDQVPAPDKFHVFLAAQSRQKFASVA